MLELHIWGPAFGLPSIDAECLAAVHYLRNVLPNESWQLIPSSNTNLNPFRTLPALRDGPTWIAGLDNIQQYLADQEGSSGDLDADLNDAQSADCEAYKSFLYSRGIPLLDLSLYISSENYTTCTRSALGELLTWPQSWTIPHQLRDNARKRSDHLGLSALDVDIAKEEDKGDTGLTAKIPKSLRKPKQTVSGLLGRSTQRTRFRLHAVTEDFLEPLNAKLTARDWLIADHITSSDCLAIAILSLMQVSGLPQPWLREALGNKYSRLGKWAQDRSSLRYSDPANDQASTNEYTTSSELPWSVAPSLSWSESSLLAMETIVSSIPLVRWGYESHEIAQHTMKQSDNPVKKQQIYASMRRQQSVYSQIVAACISTTAVLGWMSHAGLLARPYLKATKPIRRNFGEAGALLGL